MPAKILQKFLSSRLKEFEGAKGADRNRKSEDRQDHGQQNEDKHRTHNTTLKTKAGVTRTLQKPV